MEIPSSLPEEASKRLQGALRVRSPAARGTRSIEVAFEVSAHGILNVRADTMHMDSRR